jgi:ParB family chromosome partitioning protein
MSNGVAATVATSAAIAAGQPEHELPSSRVDSLSSSPNTNASSQASGRVWDARYKLRWLRTVERARPDMQQLLRERIRLPLTIADPFLAVRLTSIIFGEFQVGPCPPRLSHFCDTLSALFGEHLARARGQGSPERYSQLEREIISSYPAVLAETRAELESPESAWAKTTREQWEAYRAGNESVWARGAPDESIGVELAINDAPTVSEARRGTNYMPIADIKIPPSRQATVGNVNGLVQSMREVGQLQPIVVTPAGELIAGLHRLEAARNLGWTEISVVVLDLEGKKKQLAILDENLMRRQLPALEYAEALRERQELYESIHPETKQHRAGGASKAAKSASALSAVADSFVTDTSVRTGLRPRTIQEYTQVANISREARNVLRASPVNNKLKELVAVARLPGPEQKSVATILSRGGAKTVREAVAVARTARSTAATETTPYAVTRSPRIRKQVAEVQRLHARVEATLEEWQSTDPSGMAPLIKMWTELAKAMSSASAAVKNVEIPATACVCRGLQLNCLQCGGHGWAKEQ